MIQATYTGTDGSTWDLRNIAQDGRSVFLTDGGLMGLGHGEFDWYTQSGPITAGQRLTGFRSKERKVVLPVMLGVNLPEDQFLELSRRWWRANLPGQYGTLAIATSDGVSRSIRMRFQDDGNRSFEDDPTDEGSDTYVVTYIADFPFWMSPLVRTSYGTDPGQDFYNSAGNVYRAWTGAAHASTSTETSSNVTRTNYVTNPSAEVNATGWNARQTGVTAVRTTAEAYTGTASIAVTTAGAAADGVGISANNSNGTNPLSMSVAVKAPSGFSYRVRLSNNVDTQQAVTVTGTGDWQVTQLTLSKGSNIPTLVVDAAAAVTAVTFYVDAALVESASTPGAYFDGSTPNTYGAPPFIISSSSRVVDATIANTGDVPAWGIYTFRGPFDAWWLKVNGGMVGSYAIATGDTLVVNTNPDVQSAILTRANGTVADVTADLPNIDWRPIPVGASVPLQLSFTGTGTIDVDLPALYYRGF